MHSKNDEFKNIAIEDMNDLGYGICHIGGITVFVRRGVSGDVCDIKIIKAAKSYSVAIITSLKESSSRRSEPQCAAFFRCGGCRFLHIKRRFELELKREFVVTAMRKAKIDISVADTVFDEKRTGYRNKAQHPVSEDENGHLYTGFYAEKSHNVIKSEGCLLQPDIFSNIIASFLAKCEKAGVRAYNEETKSGLLRHIFLRRGEMTGEIMLCPVIAGESFPSSEKITAAMVREFPEIKTVILNINPNDTNVILGDKNICLFGDGKIKDTLCGLEITVSPLSFYQVNRSAAELLYRTAAEKCALSDDDILLDLYCGTGTIGLTMARRVKWLVGIEIVPEAVEDAKKNAVANGIENASFFAGDAADAERLLSGKGLMPTAVIIDPPRKGCSPEVIRYIAGLNPKKVLYISCEPDTLARDLSEFSNYGYRADVAIPVDMFPLTGHVETICVLKAQIK